MKTNFVKTTFLALVIISLASCGPAPKLAVTDGWNSAHQYEVKGNKKFLSKQTLNISDARSTYVKRSWTKSSSTRTGFGIGNPNQGDFANIISTEYMSRRQSLHFRLEDDSKNTSDVYCLANVRRSDLIVGRKNGVINTIFDIAGIGDSESNLYAVQILLNDVPQPYELLLDNIASQKSPNKYVGMIVQGNETKYSIVPANKLVGKNGKHVTIPFGSVGYEIRNKDQKAVAAISLMGKPTVYLNDVTPAEKFLLSNIAAAIVLREDIN